MPIPKRLQINAWTGQPAPEEDNFGEKKWIGTSVEMPPASLHPGALPDKNAWRDPKVGWGLVLPENVEITPKERATAQDAPAPIRELVAERSGVVLRYSDVLPKWALRRYYGSGKVHDPSIVSSPRGTADGAIPQYLLIYGSPKVIPWDVQYRLNSVSYCGRLDIDGDQLANYVRALMSEWSSAASNVRKAVVWATDHGADDITYLMRRGIAEKIHTALAGDSDIQAGAVYIDGEASGATGRQLIDALETHDPALIVTTSHGMTGPLGDIPKMRAQMGIPVDGNHQVLVMNDLLAKWSPQGAIWYAHACCSAGSDSRTSYAGVVKAGSFVEKTLDGIAKSGALVAPLPRALLGAEKPLRAFVGHVEPTFNWTIRQPKTKQLLTTSLKEALYDHLYQPEPLARALEEVHRHGAQLSLMHEQAKTAYARGEDRLDEAMAARLMSIDRSSLVVLGDPTVILPSF